MFKFYRSEFPGYNFFIKIFIVIFGDDNKRRASENTLNADRHTNPLGLVMLANSHPTSPINLVSSQQIKSISYISLTLLK